MGQPLESFSYQPSTGSQAPRVYMGNLIRSGDYKAAFDSINNPGWTRLEDDMESLKTLLSDEIKAAYNSADQGIEGTGMTKRGLLNALESYVHNYQAIRNPEKVSYISDFQESSMGNSVANDIYVAPQPDVTEETEASTVEAESARVIEFPGARRTGLEGIVSQEDRLALPPSSEKMLPALYEPAPENGSSAGTVYSISQDVEHVPPITETYSDPVVVEPVHDSPVTYASTDRENNTASEQETGSSETEPEQAGSTDQSTEDDEYTGGSGGGGSGGDGGDGTVPPSEPEGRRRIWPWVAGTVGGMLLAGYTAGVVGTYFAAKNHVPAWTDTKAVWVDETQKAYAAENDLCLDVDKVNAALAEKGYEGRISPWNFAETIMTDKAAETPNNTAHVLFGMQATDDEYSSGIYQPDSDRVKVVKTGPSFWQRLNPANWLKIYCGKMDNQKQLVKGQDGLLDDYALAADEIAARAHIPESLASHINPDFLVPCDGAAGLSAQDTIDKKVFEDPGAWQRTFRNFHREVPQ